MRKTTFALGKMATHLVQRFNPILLLLYLSALFVISGVSIEYLDYIKNIYFTALWCSQNGAEVTLLSQVTNIHGSLKTSFIQADRNYIYIYPLLNIHLADQQGFNWITGFQVLPFFVFHLTSLVARLQFVQLEFHSKYFQI